MLNGPTPLAELAAEEDVRRRRQVVAEREVLVDDLDAMLARLDRPVEDDFLSVDPDGAVRGAEISGDDLDQRRLAGAVVAHKADNLRLVEAERNIVEGLDGAEVLRNPG